MVIAGFSKIIFTYLIDVKTRKKLFKYTSNLLIMFNYTNSITIKIIPNNGPSCN